MQLVFVVVFSCSVPLVDMQGHYHVTVTVMSWGHRVKFSFHTDIKRHCHVVWLTTQDVTEVNAFSPEVIS